MTEVQSELWSPSRYQFTKAEIARLMQDLSSVFDVVRLVEPNTGTQWTLDEEDRLREGEFQCWSTWDKKARCAHCISRKAVEQQTRLTKFEFAGDDLHHVTAKYVEVDGTPCSMEMVCYVPDDTILEGYGRQEVVEAISRHNRRLYVDALTGAYNRRYLEEMFKGSLVGWTVAMFDADDFKHVNDTYGHNAGDQVLKGIVEAMTGCIRSADKVVRFGGDEFLVLFDGMARDNLPDKLEQIRQRIHGLAFAEAPGLRQTVSIGAFYGDGVITELIERADKMLYRSKAGGKDRITIE